MGGPSGVGGLDRVSVQQSSRGLPMIQQKWGALGPEDLAPPPLARGGLGCEVGGRSVSSGRGKVARSGGVVLGLEGSKFPAAAVDPLYMAGADTQPAI